MFELINKASPSIGGAVFSEGTIRVQCDILQLKILRINTKGGCYHDKWNCEVV